MATLGTSIAASGATPHVKYWSRINTAHFGEAVVAALGYTHRCSPHFSVDPKGPKHASNKNNFLLLRLSYKGGGGGGAIRAAAGEAEPMAATAISGIKIIKNPPETKLTELSVRSWPKWGCPPSKFPWTYSSKETCYLLKGKVKVYPNGSDEAVEIGAGDLVEFPKGLSCTWDVSEAVDKHYNFE